MANGKKKKQKAGISSQPQNQSVQTNGNGKNKKKKKPKNKGGGGQPQLRLDPCVLEYIWARIDPWDPRAFGACFPGSGAYPSLRLTTVFRGMLSSDAVGEELCIAVRPTCANDNPSVKAGSAVSTTIASAATQAINANGSMFTAASFTAATLEQRMIGCGIKMRQVNAPLAMQGIATGFSLHSSDSLNTALTSATMAAFPNSRVVPVRDKELKLVFGVDDVDKQAFFNPDPEWQSHGATAFIMAAFFPAPDATTKAQVMVDYVAHWELRGTMVAASAGAARSNVQQFGQAWGEINNVLRNTSAHLQDGAKTVAEVSRTVAMMSGASHLVGATAAMLRVRL
jgi:hypothetical protein